MESYVNEETLSRLPAGVAEAAIEYGMTHGAALRRGAQQGEPPFPDPNNPMLKYLVSGAMEMVVTGEATPEHALIHVAVHAWFEGHIEGREQAASNT